MTQKSDHQLRVEEFMRLAKQEIPAVPTMPCLAVRKLRANIILEEALETIEALGFTVTLKPFDLSFELSETCAPDLIEAVDGCCDLRVVTTGTLSALGVADNAVQEEVDRNNLAKFGPGSYRRESDGKWMKPPGHQKPDLEHILITQGWRNP
jgi:predicted HAD superfamily Cof-like phosphohydrolase